MSNFTGLLSLLLLLIGLVVVMATSQQQQQQQEDKPPTDAELTKAVADLRAASSAGSAALARALLLLKRLEQHRSRHPELGGGRVPASSTSAARRLIAPTFEALTAGRAALTTKTLGLPGGSAEFRLADQPDGTVFMCFNASSGASEAGDVELLSSGDRAQILVVPYNSPVLGKTLKQLELAIKPLACWDNARRYACVGLQPGDGVAFAQFKASVALC